MLHPAPTTKIDPKLARGTLEEIHAETATKPAYIVASFHNTDYRTHLEPLGGITPELKARLGKRLVGTVRAEAKRVDTCGTGGRYFEPVLGRPRRVQGVIIAADNSANTITVNAGIPITARLTDPRQRAAEFEEGQFVTFAVLRGATFELQST